MAVSIEKKGRRDFTSGFVLYHTLHIHVQHRHVFFCKTFISLPDNLYKNMKSKSNLICLVIVSDKQINKKLNNFEKKMEGYNRLVQYRIRRKNKQDK